MKLNVNSPLYVIGYAAGVSAVFTAVVVSLQVATAGRIARNEALREERALVEVFGLADDVNALSAEQCAELVRARIDRSQTVRDPETGREFHLFRAYRTAAKAELTAVGFDVGGNGFWAPIRGLMALTPDLGQVVGVVFLDHKETPGLGGRITEAAFQDAFRGISVSPPGGDAKFLYVEKDRPESPQDPRWGRTVDAITGATQTSMAVARFLNANLVQFRRAMAADTAR